MIYDQEKEREILLKYTKEYDADYVKNNFDISPCNIWGYIQALEERIIEMDLKITDLESKKKWKRGEIK